VKVLSLMSSFPAWGFGKEIGNPQGIWLWRPVGFDYRAFTGLGEAETSLLEGKKKICVHQNPGGKSSVTPQKTEPDVPARVGMSATLAYTTHTHEWTCGSEVTHCGDTGTGSSNPGRGPWHKPSWRSLLTWSQSPYTQGLGHLWSKNSTHQWIIGLPF